MSVRLRAPHVQPVCVSQQTTEALPVILEAATKVLDFLLLLKFICMGSSNLTWLGCLCMKVNYRGSTGFGKSFLHAGDAEWGVGAMQNDLTDSVEWAVQQGIADPKRVAIFGGSYGQ